MTVLYEKSRYYDAARPWVGLVRLAWHIPDQGGYRGCTWSCAWTGADTSTGRSASPLPALRLSAGVLACIGAGIAIGLVIVWWC